VSYATDLNFCILDYVATASLRTSGGIGDALYSRVREEARLLNAVGLFFECLPDDPPLSRNPDIRRQNVARLRFYERFGVTPIINNKFATPIIPGRDNPPYLMFDDLGTGRRLGREQVRAIVRPFLERKYGQRLSPEYVDMVVESFKDDPVQLRPLKYVKAPTLSSDLQSVPEHCQIAPVVAEHHDIHHVRERGYVESPARIASISRELQRTPLFRRVRAKHFPERHILAVHDSGFYEYIQRVYETLKPRESVYPYVFPVRNVARPPKDMAVRSGYYCIDTFTPLNANAYMAAREAVACALTAADETLSGVDLASALVRPPGHHAEKRTFGGFCYFNSSAIAAQYLSAYGKVAMLDVDYHHGNGQQDIFYRRSDVLTISIHGHPRFAHPYFSGFEDETGVGSGGGFNLNIPLPEHTDGQRHRVALERTHHRIQRFKPQFLVVCLGLDTAKRDPTGSWELLSQDFAANGRMIGSLRLPTLVVQKGGYDNRVLGVNARNFFKGLWEGFYEAAGPGLEGLLTKSQKER
jgi:acetoin utilization deacetylase AcuC-like enzyme